MRHQEPSNAARVAQPEAWEGSRQRVPTWDAVWLREVPLMVAAAVAAPLVAVAPFFWAPPLWVTALSWPAERLPRSGSD